MKIQSKFGKSFSFYQIFKFHEYELFFYFSIKSTFSICINDFLTQTFKNLQFNDTCLEKLTIVK